MALSSNPSWYDSLRSSSFDIPPVLSAEEYSNGHRYAEKMQYDDSFQQSKLNKEKEEQSRRNYESDRQKIENEKENIEMLSVHETDAKKLRLMLLGFSVSQSYLEEYYNTENPNIKQIKPKDIFLSIKNQPQGWKDKIVKQILNNPSTPPDALAILWKAKVVPNMGSSGFTIEGIASGSIISNLAKQILQHPNCPSSVSEEFVSYLCKYPKQAIKQKNLLIEIISSNLDFTEKAFDQLSKIPDLFKDATFLQVVARHSNAPLNIAVNYALQSENNIRELNNPKALSHLVKILGTATNLPRDKIQKIVMDNNTSTDVLYIVSKLKQDLSEAYHNQEAFDLAMQTPQDNITLEEFIKDVNYYIAIHPNAPVDWAANYCWENGIDASKIMNPKVVEKKKEKVENSVWDRLLDNIGKGDLDE